MLVYRVETEYGEGPYIGVGSSQWMCWENFEDIYHPTPEEDNLDHITVYDIFGFKFKEDLHRWFGPYFDMLDNLGLGVSTYEVSDAHVKEGSCQVAFNKDMATLIDRRSLLDLAPVTL